MPDLGLISASKCPADVACSISYMGPDGKVALTLVINQSCQYVWHHLIKNMICFFQKPTSGSLCGRRSPRLPSSARARQPPCQAPSVSRGEKSSSKLPTT